MRKILLATSALLVITAGAACSKKPAPAAPKTDTAKPADPAPAPAPAPDAPKEEAPKAP